jgi:hypothetical protein
MNSPANIVPFRQLPPPGHTSGALAVPIVTSWRPGDVADDIVDALRAHQAFARTCMLLQKSLDAAYEQKRRITKELGRAVKAAWEQFGKHFAPEEWRPVDEAMAAAREGTATDEQVETLLAWARDTRALFLSHDGAKLDKEKALKNANGRIEDLEIALRRVILEQPGAKADEPQQDLPGVKVTQAPAGGVWDAKVRRTVVEVFAEEVSTTRAKAAAPEVDTDTRAAAEAQAAADEAMVATLRAMGIADDALPEDDLEGVDDEETEASEPEQAELPIDTTATEVDPDADLDAAEKHEALGGKLPAKRGGRKGKAS